MSCCECGPSSSASSSLVPSLRRRSRLLPLLVLSLVCTSADGCFPRSVFEPEKSAEPLEATTPEVIDEEPIPCPDFFIQQGYCMHNGTCELDSFEMKPFCRCQRGWQGPRCEGMFITELVYGYSRQTAQVETATLSTLIFLAIIATCIASMALYVYRRVAKTYDVNAKTFMDNSTRETYSWMTPRSVRSGDYVSDSRHVIPFSNSPDGRLVVTTSTTESTGTTPCLPRGSPHEVQTGRPPPIARLSELDDLNIV